MIIIKARKAKTYHLAKPFLQMIFPLVLSLACTSARNPMAPLNGVDVYVAGYESNGSAHIAKYWKNGVPILLSNEIRAGTATSISHNGSDVYVTGREFSINTIGPIVKSWKNSLPTALTDGTRDAEAHAIMVSGSDVYIVGGETAYAPDEGGAAEYWKNGNRVVLTDGKQSAMARAIAISGTDIYIAGEEKQFTKLGPTTGMVVSVAKIWKNGIPITLTDGTSIDSGATSIVVVGADIYVAGWEFAGVGFDARAVAKYWKNGQSISLANGEGAIATSIAVSGNDTHVVGTRSVGAISVAMYWKNGQSFPLSDGLRPSTAKAIALAGTDVFIAGSEGSNAKYWVNGVPKNLTNGNFNASANAIVVVQR